MNHKCGVPNENPTDDSDDSLEAPQTQMNLTQDVKQPFKKFCNFPSFLGLPLQIPEQTEPEDLSMHTPRSNLSTDELEELDDAATMFMKLKQRQLGGKGAMDNLTK